MFDKARYIDVDVGVRYWEDARVNGEMDDEGKIPLRVGDSWRPVIDLSDGQIQGWPLGVTAEVHYKVCDEGTYWLLDENMQRVAKWGGYYVPDDFLCVGDRGHGDYIIFNVGDDGKIIGWKMPYVDEDRWVLCE
jgi:hypothetical protein